MLRSIIIIQCTEFYVQGPFVDGMVLEYVTPTTKIQWMHEQSLPRVLKLVTPLAYEAVALGQPLRKICCTNPHISYWHGFSVAELPVDSIALSTFYLLTLHPCTTVGMFDA